LGFRFWVLGFK